MGLLYKEPIIVNLDNDNDLEILLSTSDGFMYVIITMACFTRTSLSITGQPIFCALNS
ncbi:MAG: hypothetical protein CM15mP106_7500 [Candidatus Neomarinimicrobiota bacterium]|nr:MAG: hypothetical protein CM15mP106_7500 [Candidatus Neomarinimicrobiota bacterium]